MQAEIKIKEILGGPFSPRNKAEFISKFMNWNVDLLESAIIKHGTYSDENKNKIIKVFWNKPRK